MNSSLDCSHAEVRVTLHQASVLAEYDEPDVQREQFQPLPCTLSFLFHKVSLLCFIPGNSDRKIRPRWQQTVSPRTWITDKRPCRTRPQLVSLIELWRKEKCLMSPRYYSSGMCLTGLLLHAETVSGEQSTTSNCSHSSSSSQSLSSAAGALGSAPSSISSSSSSSTGQGPPSMQLPSSALLQDPALLHQLIPALQATLQMNNGSMDMAKLNEGEHRRARVTLFLTSAWIVVVWAFDSFYLLFFFKD